MQGKADSKSIKSPKACSNSEVRQSK